MTQDQSHEQAQQSSDADGPVGRAQVEVERKLEVPTGWVMPELGDTGNVGDAGAPEVVHQSATYLDTPWLGLLDAKHTLRRRTGGSDAGWHLKKPGKGAGRIEMYEPLGEGAGEDAVRVPGVLREEVNRVIGLEPLTPVCRLDTTRTKRPVYGRGENAPVLLEVVDDEVEAEILLDGDDARPWREVRRWREVEVEIVEGDEADLDVVVGQLLDSGCTVSRRPSKLATALQGVGVERAEGTAGAQVMAYVATQVGVIQGMEPAARRDDPDGVHKARVATRRLRSALRTYRKVVDRERTDAVRAELKWAAAALGEPRDAEVMRERILTALGALPAELVRGRADERLRESLQARHDEAHAHLVENMDSQRWTDLLIALNALVVAPPLVEGADAPATELLPRLVGKVVRDVTREAEHVLAMEPSPERDEAVHEVRKSAKQARYAAEAAGKAVGGKAAAGLVDAWKDVQDALGEHQDSVVAREVLEGIYADALAAGEDTFTYGVLIRDEVVFGERVTGGLERLLRQAGRAMRVTKG